MLTGRQFELDRTCYLKQSNEAHRQGRDEGSSPPHVVVRVCIVLKAVARQTLHCAD